jgi:hypothetical protein
MQLNLDKVMLGESESTAFGAVISREAGAGPDQTLMVEMIDHR